MRLTFLALALFALPACAQTTDTPPTTTSPIPTIEDGAPAETEIRRLGQNDIGVRIHRHAGAQGSAIAMLNLHDDENTSVEAALDVIRETGGRLVEVLHSGDRNVAFRVDGAPYQADPNRIFTAAGRERTLAALSSADPVALDALEGFAQALLILYAEEMDPAVVVTLHNNTEANYSALSYAEGGDYQTDAEAVTIHEGTDPDDFFFVTDRALYDALTSRGFNAVLQDNARATDDGSLSVWAAQNGRPYVNVEAQHGHREEQARMVRALVEVLAER